tara:strand:+ start:182 stop:568 length:387 start_codon:yes stop_codon:yes gene_type:complete
VSNPFDYVNSINVTKKDIMPDDITEKAYPAFMVNRALSYFNDTVLYANEMNVNHHIDNKLQYHFLINIIRKKKRFSKWLKPQEVNNLEIIKEYYGYSNEKAKSVLQLFNNEQIEILKQGIYKGGKRKY